MVIPVNFGTSHYFNDIRREENVSWFNYYLMYKLRLVCIARTLVKKLKKCDIIENVFLFASNMRSPELRISTNERYHLLLPHLFESERKAWYFMRFPRTRVRYNYMRPPKLWTSKFKRSNSLLQNVFKERGNARSTLYFK